uniref:Uncharacterized protein n=1 Tax=Romanomermis culicivorax TaxID=13658 RepID=A0A915J4D6_ROMCU
MIFSVVTVLITNAWFSEDEDFVRSIYSILQILSEFCEIVEYLTFFEGNRVLKAKLNKLLFAVKAIKPKKIVPAFHMIYGSPKESFFDQDRKTFCHWVIEYCCLTLYITFFVDETRDNLTRGQWLDKHFNFCRASQKMGDTVVNMIWWSDEPERRNSGFCNKMHYGARIFYSFN